MTLPLPSYDGNNLQPILDRIAQALPSGGLPNAPRIVSGGKQNISASESTTSTTYTTLTTPDSVTVVLPTDGLLLVGYQALWQNTVANNARAAIFLGANQIKIGADSGGAGGAPAVNEATGNATINVDAILAATSAGLLNYNATANASDVSTGQILGWGSGFTNGRGGPCFIFAAAGTYGVSIQFKNVAAGTLTASKRHLWVAGYSFA